MKATRDGFGEALLALGKQDEQVVALSADLEDSTRAIWFKKEFPDRFFTVGIAEQDMFGTAAGLALAGKIPFACSFACFLLRGVDQIRISICFNNANVKINGSHAGLMVGADGGTAQEMEDIAIFRALPNMTVLVPADATETYKATMAAAKHRGPVYIRTGRAPVPDCTDKDAPFQIGKTSLLRDGGDVAILACGSMIQPALDAADALAKDGIKATVANVSTIKPIDKDTILKLAREIGTFVTAEEHQASCGLGSAVAEVTSQHCPVPIRMVAMPDAFGESGQPDELLAKYHMTAGDIAAAAKAALKK